MVFMEPMLELLYGNRVRIEMRGISNKKYNGRYTVQEFARAKHLMLERFLDELGVGKIDAILRYCAKNDWPAERSDTYHFASLHGHAELLALEFYDVAQDFLDKVHHGENFMRVWEEYEGIDESKRDVDVERLVCLVSASAEGGIGNSVIGPYRKYLEK